MHSYKDRKIPTILIQSRGIMSGSPKAMNLSLATVQFFALICFRLVYFARSVQPESKNFAQFSVSEFGEIDQSAYEEVMVISESQVIATTNDTLCLLEYENATTVLAAEETLQARPSELHVVSFEGTISIAVGHADFLDVYQYSRNSPSNDWRRKRITRVYYDPYEAENSVEYEPSSNVVLSARVRNSRLYINAVYIFDNGWIVAFNPLIRYSGFLDLPADCSCDHNCQLQPSYNDRQGQVILKCSNNRQYLCNLYEEECFLVPPTVQWIVTSKVNRKLAIAIKHNQDLNQDLLLIVSFADDHDTTYVTLASSKASVTQPGRIRDLAILQINGSDQEVACFLDSYNAIHCFVLNSVNEWPAIETVTLPSNVTTVNRFQGATNSSLAIEVTYQDNQTLLMLIGITISELGNSVQELNSTACPNQTITLLTVIEPAITTTHHAECTITSMPSATTVLTPTLDDKPGTIDDSARRDRVVEIIAISIAITTVVILVIAIGLFFFLYKYSTILRQRPPN